jgi:hypothetical protein
MREQLGRCHQLLTAAYETRRSWLREVWDPDLDARIPQRVHELRGRHSIHFDRIGADWLRRGAQWHCKVGLKPVPRRGERPSRRVDTLAPFDAFLACRAVPRPWLADEPTEFRMLMLDYLGHIRARRAERPGPSQGKPLSRSRVGALQCGVEQLYPFIHDNRDTAAEALSEPGWRRLGRTTPCSSAAVRNPAGDARHASPRSSTPTPSARSRPASVCSRRPPKKAGSVTSRPCTSSCCWPAPVGGSTRSACWTEIRYWRWTSPPSATEADGFVARLHYQQTKIHGARHTILVDQETVAIIRARQQ